MMAPALNVDIDAIADAIAQKIGDKIGRKAQDAIVWNCPNALVDISQIATFTGYSVRSIANFLNEPGAPTPVKMSGKGDRRYFVRDIVNYFEKNKKH